MQDFKKSVVYQIYPSSIRSTPSPSWTPTGTDWEN